MRRRANVMKKHFEAFLCKIYTQHMEFNQSNSTEWKKNEDVAKLFAWKSFRFFLADNWPLKRIKMQLYQKQIKINVLHVSRMKKKIDKKKGKNERTMRIRHSLSQMQRKNRTSQEQIPLNSKMKRINWKTAPQNTKQSVTKTVTNNNIK